MFKNLKGPVSMAWGWAVVSTLSCSSAPGTAGSPNESGSLGGGGNPNGAPGTSGSGGIDSNASGENGGTGLSGSGGPTGNGGSNTAGGLGTNPNGGSGSGASGNGGSGNGASGAGSTPPFGSAPRVDNPYADGTGYVNPEWRAKAAGEPGGDRVANTPTAVWLDRIAAIAGTSNSPTNGAMGLRDHLDAALKEGASFVQFVIYDLPGRDCAALASNGELGPTDLPRYESEYIDPIAAIEGDPKYGGLRIVNIIEPDSLPNLVTNTSIAACATMKANGGYVQGVAYALEQLGAIANVYNYLDAGHHGWLGWDSNLGPSVDVFAQTATTAGFKTVRGFITNTANYSALTEPFFTAASTVNGTTVRQSKWVDWNNYVDELSYAQALRAKLVSAGFDSSIGMLIDTSRNGWGGSKRPPGPGSSTDVNGFVDGSRIDRRIHAGNWCNQSGAGLGERPTASPTPFVHAYVWIKPPGESDGSSTAIVNSDGKGFDRMCDPTYGGNSLNGNNPTGALAGAPLAGAWFSAQFQELLKNAYPAL